MAIWGGFNDFNDGIDELDVEILARQLERDSKYGSLFSNHWRDFKQEARDTLLSEKDNW